MLIYFYIYLIILQTSDEGEKKDDSNTIFYLVLVSLRGGIGGWNPVVANFLMHYSNNIGKALKNWENNKVSGNAKEKITYPPTLNPSTLANICCIQKTECDTEERWQKREKTTSEISKCFPVIETRLKFKFEGNILVHQILFIKKSLFCRINV